MLHILRKLKTDVGIGVAVAQRAEPAISYGPHVLEVLRALFCLRVDRDGLFIGYGMLGVMTVMACLLLADLWQLSYWLTGCLLGRATC